jgi:hypothetical protein
VFRNVPRRSREGVKGEVRLEGGRAVFSNDFARRLLDDMRVSSQALSSA